MNVFEDYISQFSKDWKEKFGKILEDEHLRSTSRNIQSFKNETLDWELPYFNEEIKFDRSESFKTFIDILKSENFYEKKTKLLEEIPFEHWLNILGQRLTSASLRDENAIPPLENILIESCRKPFNNEVSMAQRACEKHIGRINDRFWGEIKGNNQQKQQKVMAKITYIIENKTWWNVFYHYKHELVYEIREKDGHGIRWSQDGTRLIGFLESFINE